MHLQKVLNAVCGALFLFLSLEPCHAADDQVLKNAIERLADSWRKIIVTNEPYVFDCIGNGYRLAKFSSTSTVRFDLKRTDSMLNPAIGIIDITGVLMGNGQSQNVGGFVSQGCWPAVEDAKAHQRPEDFSPEFNSTPDEFLISYSFENGVPVVLSGNPPFLNGILRNFDRAHNRDNRAWADALAPGGHK